LSDGKEKPQLKSLKPRPTPDDLIQVVSEQFGSERESILRKGKKRNIARDLTIYLCWEMTGETMFSINHMVITGTGRSGTTFLVELLTRLGLETGFSVDDIESNKYKEARAGLEHDIRQKDSPYIVKSPYFCDYAEEVICREDIVIDHVFIPIRDLYAAAESRRYVEKTTISNFPFIKRLKHKIKQKEVPGGLWYARPGNPGVQEEVLLKKIYKLMLDISDANIPVTLMRYPRITKDGPYLFEKLKPILRDIAYESFFEAFNKTVRPELVHSFNKNDC